ncbi:MAG TPA: FkbM family methyltransferase [Gemmatimonadaceae bacterium]|nr:FkbM family methyltransferase [Gemmatimonadaceae bacterium]
MPGALTGRAVAANASALRRAGRLFRNAFRSPGVRQFGFRFAWDYLRMAWRAGRRWGSAAPGTLRFFGCRIAYPNQSHAVFLAHELFVNAAYDFDARTENPCIIDAGANIGMATVYFKARYPGARVTAYEPDPATFAILRGNVDANGLRGVTLIRAAVGDRAGVLPLYRETTSGGSVVASLDPSWGGAEAIEVPVIRLSDAITEPVDLLKLDVEGAEYAVLRDLAAAGRLAMVRETVIEYHPLAAEPNGETGLAELLRSAGMDVIVTPGPTEAHAGIIRGRRPQIPTN